MQIDNAEIKKILNKNDEVVAYDIAPIDGYVLHNACYDTYETKTKMDGDEEVTVQGELVVRGYTRGSCSVVVDYDFNTNPEEIYTKKIEDIDENEEIY